ncbi:MAG TPA: hypothetical protein VIT44_19075 [Cyclobacteriaceae bacterium]
MNRTILYLLFVGTSCMSTSSLTTDTIDKFSWLTGYDISTIQLIPAQGNNPIVKENGHAIVHVQFNVKQYGEVSFPINFETPEGAEALRADLSKSKGITFTYQSNHEFIIQLRQTGVHGGVHNHFVLPASKGVTTRSILFTEFNAGKTPLDLTDVAKFNFAFLSNPDNGYAELKITTIAIDGMK